MDIGVGAFGVDLLASRVYFINPVLDPQVEAQAIGRARRTSQKRSVTVETLVLRGSLEELILRRREEMTQAEQRKCKSMLDDKPIYEWIANAKILPLPEGEGEVDDDGLAQTAMLQEPQLIFGPGSGRNLYATKGSAPPAGPSPAAAVSPAASRGASNNAAAAGAAALLLSHHQQRGTPSRGGQEQARRSDSMEAASALTQLLGPSASRKRTFDAANAGPSTPSALRNGGGAAAPGSTDSPRPSRRVRFMGGGDGGEGD